MPTDEVRAGRVDWLARALVLAASLLLVAATFVPTNGGGKAGYPYAIYDRSVQRELQLFAAEPLVVALLASAVAILVVPRARHVGAGALLAFGLQTSVLFLAYFGGAVFGNPLYNSFRPGSVLGLFGAGLLIAAGGLLLLGSRRR